jgi:uncharacterized repeat protein (TIGR01451 family)
VPAKDQGGDDFLDSDIDQSTGLTDIETLISGENDDPIDAAFYALYANVFDPPSALKTVGDSGENEVEWKMVWINDGNMVAINTQILDDVPTGTTYVSDSVNCEARGLSFTTVCTYDSIADRIRWEGNIAPDEGGTDEDDSLNEVVITYRTSVPEEMETVDNQAIAYWDSNGDGDFSDDITRGQDPELSDDPASDPSLDPTVWTRKDRTTGDSSIGDYVWHDKDGDGKQDDDENGIKSVRVKLIWAGPDGDFGNHDDNTWKDTTNLEGRYHFNDLPTGNYRVEINEDDLKGWVQTYDPSGEKNGKAPVRLKKDMEYSKADFGYNQKETELAKTGDNGMLWFLVICLWSIISM